MSSPSLSTSAPLAMTGYLRSQTLDPSLPSHRIKPGAPAQWGKEGPHLPQGSSARGHALLTHYHLSTAWPKRQSFRSGSTPIYSMGADFVFSFKPARPSPRRRRRQSFSEDAEPLHAAMLLLSLAPRAPQSQIHSWKTTVLRMRKASSRDSNTSTDNIQVALLGGRYKSLKYTGLGNGGTVQSLWKPGTKASTVTGAARLDSSDFLPDSRYY